MKTRWKLGALMMLAGLGGACDSTPTPGSNVGGASLIATGTVRGQVGGEIGQRVSPALGAVAASGSVQATAVRAVDLTEGSVLAAGVVGADGAFVLHGVPTQEAPFLVEAIDAAGEIVAQVVVPGPLTAGGELVTMPLGAETTAEAQAWAELASAGAAPDPVALFMLVSAEMASSLSAGATWSEAVGAGVQAWGHALAHLSSDATASAVAEARAQAWADLAAALDAASTAEEEQQAWAAFSSGVTAAIEAATGLDASAQATATAAAGHAMLAATDGAQVGDAAVSHAVAASAALSARAHQQAQLDAAAALDQSVLAAVEGAYDAWFEAVASATTLGAIEAAQADLAAALNGGAESALGAALGLSGGDAQVAAIVGAAAAAQGSLDGALGALASPEGIAEAFASFHGHMQAASEAAMQGGASAPLVDLAASAAAQAAFAGALVPPSTGEGAAVDGAPAVDGEATVDGAGDGQATVEGAVEATVEAAGDATAGGTAGALVEGLDTGMAGAVDAAVIAIDEAGAVTVIGDGEVSGGVWTVVLDAAAQAELAVLVLTDLSGEIVGAALISGGVDGGFEAPDLTAETTAQVEVLLAALDGGATPSQVDMELLASLISGATATAIVAEDGAAAASAALELAAAVQAKAEQAGASPALIVAEVSAAFEAAMASSGSTLPSAVDAETQVANAIAATAALQAAGKSGAVVALQALIQATAEATSGDEIQAAGAAFEGNLLASLKGDLLAGLSLPLGLDAAMAASAAAKAELAATIQKVVGAGDVDTQAALIVEAFGTLSGATSGAFEKLPVGAASATIEAITLLNAGLYGTSF